ncbi:MAG: gliding motility-associated C-terminal domain-containing protein [Sphingobacteriaceae bacterium]|nr:gliding motility-associated C-terminal domain-containing protein [Sphingobacteriaceae bacterium]
MRIKLLVFCLMIAFGSLQSFSQNQKLSFSKKYISPDSLKGFDEGAFRINAITDRILAEEYEIALYLAKKQFIIDKYYPNAYDINNYKIPPSNNMMFNPPCVNEGFELGNFTGWTLTQGTNTNSCSYPTATIPLSPGPTATILSTPLVDPVTGFLLPNSPLGGTMVAKLNNQTGGAGVTKMTQNFVVTNSNYLYDFAYFAVQNGPHNCCNQPYMFVRLRDCVGNLLACPNFTFNAPATNSNACPGTGPTSWVNTGVCPGGECIWRTNGWQKYSIDLTQYIGTCVTIEVMVGDCPFVAHYLYTYFDSNCNTMNLVVNGTNTVSMPSQTVTPQVLCGTTATLTAPGGLNPYLWNGPPLSGVTNNTNQTISTSVAGNYTLVMTPTGVCTPIFRIINLQFVPPATVNVNPPGGICGGSATLTASGATNYTWMPGGSNSPTLVVTPTITTIYSLTANTGSCTGTQTVQVVVNPSPTLNISASSLSVCAGMPTTLTASGASTYTWSTGANGASTIVNPTTTTTYSVIGTSSTGCIGTASITINVVPTPTNFVTLASPTVICIGGNANLFASALGATSYTWFPGGLVGNFVNVSPTVTTQYTVIAANGGCTNSAVVSLSVDPGPTMTVVASPTAICPGSSATLSASGAVSFTWLPMGSTGTSVVVSPTVTTTYTVQGVTGLGCPGTQTISEVVIPAPNLTISPTSPSICIGSAITLTASGATSYTWNPGGINTATIALNPTVTTSYTLIGSNGTCTSTISTTLVVNPVPTVVASSSSPSICAGSSASLIGSGATSYTWLPGALTGATVVVSPTVTTNYTVIGSNGTCTNSSMVTLTVNTGPTITANASPTVICAGSSSTLTANGAISYTWNPGALTGPSISVSPGSTTIYSVIGNNIIGCTTTQTLNLIVNPNPTITSNASPSVICNGNSSTLTANGASTYTWNPGALTGSNIVVSPTVSTTYTIIGQTLGCNGTGTLAVVVVPTPTVSAVANPTTICSGSSSTLTANGAVTYTWNPGALTGSAVVVTPLVSTTYTVSGSSGGCSSNATVSLIVNPTPTIIANASPTAICVTGNVTLTANGASTYTWNPGALSGSSVVVSPLVTTSYSVTGTNGFGCTGSTIVTVTVNAVPTITIVASPTAICSGGASTLSVTGAVAYTWNPGGLTGSSVVVSPTSTTIYTVLASNGGCSTNGTISLIVNPLPTITAVASPSNICSGSSSTLSALGGISYTWNPGALSGSTVNVTPSITTIYTVTGSNVFGCTNNTIVTVSVTPTPTILANANPTAICVGSNATLTASGATSYTWSPGALTGSNIVVTPTSTTLYTVTGANGACTTSQTLNLIVNPNPTLIANGSPNPVCIGNPVTLTVTGAVNYTWNPGAITGSNVVVSPTVNTNYTVTGTNLSGCSGTAIVNVTVNPLPTLTITSTNSNVCAGNSATLTGSGAVSYLWNPGGILGSTIAVTPTATTIYTLVGTSSVGCINTQTFMQMVTPNPTVVAISNPTNICAGSSSSLTANGASGYTWNPGGLTGSLVVVNPSITTIYTVTGANGLCVNMQTVSVQVTPSPTLNVGANPNPSCAGSVVSLTVSGANSYTWLNPPGISSTIIAVSPVVNTTYSVMGTNLSGCTSTISITVTVNPLPSLTVTSTNSNICAGNSATLTGSGAVGYLWNPGGIIGNTIAVSPTTTTIYTLIGTSAQGCTSSINYTQTVTPNPTVNATASPSTICFGNTTTLTANGATSYTWNPGGLIGSTITISPSVTSVYTVTGANGPCSMNQTITVIVNPTPTLITIASPTVICSGNSSTLTVSGANSYTWNPGALTGTAIVVSPSINTTYTVVGQSLAGCTSSAVINLSVNATPTLSIVESATNICIGSSATLTASGASSYTWNPGILTGSNIVITPTANTVYTLIGTGIGGCTASAQSTIVVGPGPTVTANASPSVVCAGSSATLTANGATSYTWNPGALTGSMVVVSPTINTTYTVNGSNGFCISSAVVSLSVIPSPTILANASPTVVCSGGTVTLTASGALLYAWLPPAVSGSTITVNPTVTTNYTVVGSSGSCTNTAVVTVSVDQGPLVNIVATPTAICAGSSATLTANGATNYTWQPGGLNSTSIVVSPTINTTYTLIGNSGGCDGMSNITLTVNSNPTITANASPTVVCAGSLVNLTASGASSYSWNPIGVTGATVTDSPTITTNYTVIGTDNNGCIGNTIATVSVNAAPSITVVASPTSICEGSSATLTAGGGIVTFTWNPGALNGSSIVVSPTLTTTYTISGNDLGGCAGSETVQLVVFPTTPTILATASPTAICEGSSATLTANGATSYTWNPGALTGSMVIVTPTATTIYTIDGSNGICGSSSTTLSLEVNEVPANVTASVSSEITCSTPSVNLFGASTSTNVSYLWSGPFGYTSAVQNPTGIAISGTYTLTVINNSGGCSADATVAVNTDSTIPTVTVTINGTITCSNPTATLNAVCSATNASFNWSGPSSFTSSLQSPTVNLGGNYTLTVIDLDNTCQASTIFVVITNTGVPITATIIPATCSGTMANNDAMIIVSGFGANDHYDYVTGLTYTGVATYTSAPVIPITGILTNTLNNPGSPTPYTVRFFAENGCIKDTTMFLLPTSCITNTVFGIAKAVSSPTLNIDGSYDVSYSIVVKNNGPDELNDITLIENLSATFPSPTTFSIISAPLVTSLNSSLTLDIAYDGTLQTVMTQSATSKLAAGKSDTIMFTVNIIPNGIFGPFNNSVIGFASPTLGVVFGDSSNTGYEPDPDLNGNPTDNNLPTILNLNPNLFFGLTKVGMLGEKNDNDSYDISYTVTVHNKGNDTLYNVIIKDSLFNNTIKAPATYIMKAGPIINGNGSLTANNSYNGNGEVNLTMPAQSKMPPNTTASIEFTINVTPDTVTIVKNSAYGNALSSNNTLVNDTSNNGNDPDSNSNGIWNEAADNVPTILIIPNTGTLFIPNGFTPNGDNKNDLWVINGLPKETKVTIYNRWGNKVYQNSNYDNTWNGYPNVTGTIGSDKLSQGTYYYIIEFKDSTIGTKNGFVVIQY